MNIFSTVNIVAVIGTALLMMSVSVIWFSSVAFGTAWTRAVQKQDIHKNRKRMVLTLCLTFVSYAIALGVLSCTIVIANLLAMPLWIFGICTYALVCALLSALVLGEDRPLAYYLIHAGFVLVFIMGGIYVLCYWPW